MNKQEIRNIAKLNIKREKTAKIRLSLTISLVFLSIFLLIVIVFYGYIGYYLSKERSNYIITIERIEPLYSNKLKEGIENINIYDRICSFALILDAPIHVGDFDRCKENVFLDGERLISNKTFKNSNINGENKYGTEIFYSSKFNNDSYIETINEKDYAVLNYATVLQAVDTNLSDNKFTLDSLYDKYGLTDGEGFKGNAKNQILVSERFLQFFNISKENLIGKTISYDIDYIVYDDVDVNNLILDNDTIIGNEIDLNYLKNEMPMSIHIFKDFQIVGIFSNEYLQFNYNSDLIVSKNSFNEDNFPQIEKQGSQFIATYNSNDYENYSLEVVNNGNVFPFLLYNKYASEYIGNNYFYKIQNNITDFEPIKLTKLQASNLKAAKSFYNSINNLKDNTMVGIHDLNSLLFTSNLRTILNLNRWINIINLFLIVYGGIVLITTVINFYNTISFHLKKRKHILKFFNIMGFTPKDIKTLFNMEIGRLFAISIIYSIIIFIVLSIIILFAILDFSFFDYKILYTVYAIAVLIILLLMVLSIKALQKILTKKTYKEFLRLNRL